MNPEIFKAYDIRGIYPTDMNAIDVKAIAKAYATFLKPKRVALGRDVRLSGPELWLAAAQGLTEMGVDVVDIGVISTDMLYFAVASYGLDGGMTITGSHNPKEFNGIKMVRGNAEPISGDTGIYEIRNLAIAGEFPIPESKGVLSTLDITEGYIDKLLEFVDISLIKPLKVVVNPNFGSGGKIIQKIADRLGIKLIKLNFEADGNFPKGRPDPLIQELRVETSELVKSSHADMGVAWDSDADRIFWYDENGVFVDGCYEGAILSKIILRKKPGAAIVHDIRLQWAADATIKENGGIPLANKAGHSFMKERMRKEEAEFGFENSAHIFFKEYYYCDNGMIPWLMILEELSLTGKKLSEIVNPLRIKYPISEEINFVVPDARVVFERIKDKYSSCIFDYTEGLTVNCKGYQFNIRESNTGETLIRLNIEAKQKELIPEKIAELTEAIGGKKA
jgi:phosphomannomutase